MLKSYFKVALRNLQRQKSYSFINVLGLAIGLACCMVILIHVQDELSFDSFHKNAERIYRVNRDWKRPDGGGLAANSPAAFGPNLMAEFPIVENFTRVMFPYPQSVLISHGDQRFYEEGFYWADSTFFEVFSFALERGDPRTALKEINSLVLTNEMAHKNFGDADPIGKTLTIDGWTKDDYKITGVLADVPHNSHLQFDFLGSVRGADQRYTYLYSGEGQWTNSLGYTYILLREGAQPEDLETQLPDFGERHLGDFARDRGFTPGFNLQPLTEIYLHAGLSVEPGPTSDITYVYIFTAIAILILIIACINYMNLATARSARRAREVGMRKVLGAQQLSLMWQFIGESLLVSFAALFIALVLVELILPVFNELSGKNLAFGYLQNARLLAGLVGIAVIVGLLAGSYPAFALSAFRPVATLKGEFKSGVRGLLLRKGLITMQFIASIVLLIATAVVVRQLEYVRSQPLGFDREHVAVLPIRDAGMRNSVETVKQKFLQHPNIVSTAAVAGVPGRTMLIDGFPVLPAGADKSAQISMQIVGVDEDFFETLNIELLSGRVFEKGRRADSASAFVVNQSAAEAFDWDDPVGQRIELVMNNGKKGVIIGVVKDFHFESLHQKIEPAVFHIWPERFSCFAVKMRAANVAGSIAFLQSVWAEIVPNQPFEFFFLDQEFDRQYRKDERIGRIFGYAAALAIFVACLGLLGLAAFAAEQRTKEIGVRKVLGATIANVTALLTKDFVKLVALANLIAWPVAWYAMNKWLQNFAYQTDLSWQVFALAGGLTLLIALITVSTQAIRAALANPVESLRYE